MKKVLGTIIAGVFLVACGGGEHKAIETVASQATGNTTSSETTTVNTMSATQTTTATPAVTATTTAAAAPVDNKADIQKGMTLLAKSDCLTCHKIGEKVIGPSYKDVAKKYTASASNIKMLAGKIIKGGSGVWGPIPMTAHATLSQADAELMVKYILSLK